MRPMRSLGRSSMNFDTTDLTTSMRFTRRSSTRKSSACMDPDTSRPSTMSMPLAVTGVLLWLRCGRANPTIMSAAASSGSSHSQPPARVRLLRATSRARPTSEYSMAATGPARPRNSITTGTSARSHSHSGCRKRITGLLDAGRRGLARRRRGRGFGRFGHEAARAGMQGFQYQPGQGYAGELGQIALIEELGQQAAVRGERGVRGFEQIAQELLRGAMGGRDHELHFDVLAHDIRYGDGEFARARRLQEPADFLETLQRPLEGQQHPWSVAPPPPEPEGVAADEQQRGGRQQ